MMYLRVSICLSCDGKKQYISHLGTKSTMQAAITNHSTMVNDDEKDQRFDS